MNVEELFQRADFSRNPAHREELRQELFGADRRGLWDGVPDGRGLWDVEPDDGELTDDMLEQAAGGVGNVPPGKDLRHGHSLFDNE